MTADDMVASGVSKDWILFVASNGNPDRIGDSVLIPEDRQMLFASFLQGITSKDRSELLPGFLSAWMRIHRVHEAFSKTSQQTTGLGNFSWSAVKRLPVRFPKDPKEQKKIISILNDIDRAIAQTREELQAARRLKTALMQQLFTKGIPGRHKKFKETKIGSIPYEWEIIDLRSIAEVGSGITLNKERAPQKNMRQYLTVVNVQRDKIDLSEARFLEMRDSEIPERLLAKGDILVVEGHANSSEIGRAAMVQKDAQGMTYQNHLFRVRILEGVSYNKDFLLGYLNSERVRRHWNATANTSSGLNTINRRGLRKLLIPKPRENEQDEITALLETANDTIESCKNKVIATTRLKKSLLQNFLTGKVCVNMEAAHELLRGKDG